MSWTFLEAKSGDKQVWFFFLPLQTTFWHKHVKARFRVTAGKTKLTKPSCDFATYNMPSQFPLVRLVFWVAFEKHKTTRMEIAILVALSWTQNCRLTLGPVKGSTLSCYSAGRLALNPRGTSCQSCEWPAWVIYTLPSKLPCHVAGK